MENILGSFLDLSHGLNTKDAGQFVCVSYSEVRPPVFHSAVFYPHKVYGTKL